ncbi:M20/M25/M40 family metallo-hydrolase, partial [Oscillospiraceae bacterium OttesenSCG-928-G22]|nr:M20/M25/M40 family metallo-hydrolase [Oscillospiraceae bacterium OttesenSCG-928-G22]
MNDFFVVIFTIAAIVLVLFFATLLFRAARIKNRKRPGLKTPDPEPDIARRAAESLSAVIRFETVNTGNKRDFDASSFRSLHSYLKTRYPSFHKQASIETVNDYSLVYRLPGRGEAPPYLFSANLDVVPASGHWEHEPFSGDIENGMVWGRGAIDGKSVFVCMLEAAERLAADGIVPPRDLYFAFGHDGESGGAEGALAISERFRDKHLTFDLVLEGGTPITRELLPLGQPLALVSVTEKGKLTLGLRVASTGGHTAIPPRHTALALLSEAICRVDYRERPPVP